MTHDHPAGPLLVNGAVRGIAVALITAPEGDDCSDRQLAMDVWLDVAAPPISEFLSNLADLEILHVIGFGDPVGDNDDNGDHYDDG